MIFFNKFVCHLIRQTVADFNAYPKHRILRSFLISADCAINEYVERRKHTPIAINVYRHSATIQ